jgi:hypothetical protein
MNSKLLADATSLDPITRAAFDLGSGTFKLSIAEVTGNEVKVKFSKVIGVGLGHDLAESFSGAFSQKIQDLALNALLKLFRYAQEKEAIQFAGIATAAFRHAVNGKEFLHKLQKATGINLQLVSQEEEGVLAFKTFLNAFPELKAENCIALDIGAASFQLTAKNRGSYEVLKGSLGVSEVLKIFSTEIRNLPYQRGVLFTPLKINEIELLIKTIQNRITSHSWLMTRLLDKEVKILYLDDWVDEIQQHVNQKNQVSKTDIWEALTKTIDLTNSAPNLKKQSYVMTYTLLYSIMTKLQIPELWIKWHNTGSTPGMMTENHLWSLPK